MAQSGLTVLFVLSALLLASFLPVINAQSTNSTSSTTGGSFGSSTTGSNVTISVTGTVIVVTVTLTGNSLASFNATAWQIAVSITLNVPASWITVTITTSRKREVMASGVVNTKVTYPAGAAVPSQNSVTTSFTNSPQLSQVITSANLQQNGGYAVTSTPIATSGGGGGGGGGLSGGDIAAIVVVPIVVIAGVIIAVVLVRRWRSGLHQRGNQLEQIYANI